MIRFLASKIKIFRPNQMQIRDTDTDQDPNAMCIYARAVFVPHALFAAEPEPDNTNEPRLQGRERLERLELDASVGFTC